MCDQVVDLTEPLVQFIKSGSTKPALRVDAIYSFLLVSKIAAVHSKASRCSPHRSVSFCALQPCTTSCILQKQLRLDNDGNGAVH
jgi:hypothetical protein